MSARSCPTRWIGWIRSLLDSASSRILVNGEASDYFRHARGLRQGDPLSPMLFIIAVDILQQMVRVLNASVKRPITAKIKESIVALQYADTVFITNGYKDTLVAFKLLLRIFTAISGLKINYLKSSIVPFNMQPDKIAKAEAVLGCSREALPIKYLGMPLTLTAPKRAEFMLLIEKMERRLQGWQAKLISGGGRFQLVRSVLSALPVYFMTCFRLPQWIIKGINSIRRGFLWGRNQGSSKGMSLINWDTVCMPREVGEVRILVINLQNISLLLRWWWRPNTEPTAMWTGIIKRIRITTSGGVSRWISGGTFFWKSLLKLLYWLSWSCEREGERLKWNWENSGLYSSRSFYYLVKTGGRERWPSRRFGL